MAESERVQWLFLDLNSYFASVEQETRPELRQKPVAVVPMMADTTCCIAASYETPALLCVANTFQNVRRFGNVGDSFAHAPPKLRALCVDQYGGSDSDVGVAFAIGVEQAVLADHLGPGVAEDGELFLDSLFPDRVGVLDVIHADGNQVRVELIEVGFVPRELAQLDYAERSPIAAVEDDEDAMALLVGEMVGLSVLVGEGEVGGRQSRGGGDLRLGQLHLLREYDGADASDREDGN